MRVAEPGLMSVWRCWPGTRATAQGAAGRGRVLLVMGRGKSNKILEGEMSWARGEVVESRKQRETARAQLRAPLERE